MTIDDQVTLIGDAGTAPDLSVKNFAICEVQRGMRLIGAAVEAPTAYLVLAGQMHMTLPDFGPVLAARGSVVLLPAHMKPAIAFDDKAQLDVTATRACLARHEGLLVFDAANARPGDLRVLVGRVGSSDRTSESLLGAIAKPVVGDLSDLPIVNDAIERVIAEVDRPNFGSAALIAAMMKMCLVLFARRVRGELIASTRPAATLSPQLSTVVGMIVARPNDAFSVESLADLAGMSRSTFARHFTEALGLTPMEYVLRARLQHASNLLRDTRLSIKQIAAASGFLSRSHFSRAFRSGFGIDPKGFRSAEHGEEAFDAPA